MNILKYVNNFFFLSEEDEKICSSDLLWFYGGIGTMITIGTFTLIF